MPAETFANPSGNETLPVDVNVSIILPTYNRASFLPSAFQSIAAQRYRNWELIVVDDGSTDHSRQLISDWISTVQQPCRYIYQANQGAYGARNAGFAASRGQYVAFFDSDDEWLPHHLQDCVKALDRNPSVDWVYGACRIVDADSGREIAPTTFYIDNQPRPFLKLRTVVDDRLRIIADSEVWRCAVLHGLYCGLQNSVLRRNVLSKDAFDTAYRNEAEDQLAVVRCLTKRKIFAYFDNVHVVYHIHEGNSSAAAVNQDLEKRKEIIRALLLGYEKLRDELSLSPDQRRILDRRLSQEYFWRLGYALLWQQGRTHEALAMFRRGIQLWPWNARYWKTYGWAITRQRIRQFRSGFSRTGPVDP